MSEHTKDGNAGLKTTETLLADIRKLATEGQFAKAHEVREELVQRFPMELNSIVRSAELIEEQMSLQIDRDHQAIWSKLYEQLTQEEKNCFFHSMHKVTVPKGKLLVRQAKPETRLLLIDSGRVTLFHTRGDERILLGQISRGDFLGDETFFSLSTPTFSAGTQSEVQLYYLNKRDTSRWEETHPGLYAKITQFCEKNSRAAELLKENNFEKRFYSRQQVEGKVKIRVISDQALQGSSYGVGSLVDVSKGGVSFDIHCSQPDNARMLLGCELDLAFQASSGDNAASVHLPGLVVCVNDLHYNDFMLHVSFKSGFSDQELEKLLRFLGKR